MERDGRPLTGDYMYKGKSFSLRPAGLEAGRVSYRTPVLMDPDSSEVHAGLAFRTVSFHLQYR